MSPRATTRPSSASITNTLRLLCTSSPTYASIGLPSSVRLGRNATPWSAVDLTAAEGSPPSSIRDRGLGQRQKPRSWRLLPRHHLDPDRPTITCSFVRDGVTSALERIKTGQRIRVDGTRGFVQILEAP